MDFENPTPDPLQQLSQWLTESRDRTMLPNPNAMTLATVDPDGRPSARVVLLKEVDERGVVFFTNYESRKGQALAANPWAALVLHWDVLDRQVRLEGGVRRVSREESDAYFAARPRASRIGAWASQQSETVSDRATLERQVAEVEARFPGESIPRPPHWGGFRLEPDALEFWQGRVGRVHDRMRYRRDTSGAWRVDRLQP